MFREKKIKGIKNNVVAQLRSNATTTLDLSAKRLGTNHFRRICDELKVDVKLFPYLGGFDPFFAG